MKEVFKIILEWVVLIAIIVIVAASLTSCSANFHVKRSQHHLEKAIAKGYEPLNDTIRTANSIKPVSVNISTPNRALIVNRIDSILKVNNCLDTLISSQIMKVVDTVIYYYEVDTTLTADNGAKVRIKLDNGMVYAFWENLQNKQTVYVERMPAWTRWLIGFNILILLLFIIRVVLRARL